MVSGHPPIKAQKIRYYQDVNFKTRMRAPPPLLNGYYASQFFGEPKNVRAAEPADEAGRTSS